MFSVEELQKIMRSNKFHWSAKARLAHKFHNDKCKQFITWNFEQTAYQLNIGVSQVLKYLMLGNYINMYPKLCQLNARKEALDLLTQYKDTNQLREQINLAAIRAQLTKNMKEKIRNVESTDLSTLNEGDNSVED